MGCTSEQCNRNPLLSAVLGFLATRDTINADDTKLVSAGWHHLLSCLENATSGGQYLAARKANGYGSILACPILRRVPDTPDRTSVKIGCQIET